MSADPYILEMRDVSVDEARGYDSAVREVSLCLGRGDVVLVEVPGHQSETPLGDAATGLCALDTGTVRFDDRDWADMSPADVFDARSRIGRVFGGSAWLSNLDLDENIMLSIRHHRSADAQELEARMQLLAGRFGVSEVLDKRPAWVSRSERQRAQWVRALAGTPGLLILEHPERDVSETHKAALLASVTTVLQEGAAAVWITTGSTGAQKEAFPGAQRFRMLNQAWLPDTI